MANVLKMDQQLQVITLLVNGNSIRSCERITGIHRDTICRLLVRVGNGCKEFLDVMLRNLKLRHLECDEIWTFVGKKQNKLEAATKREIYNQGDIYLWTACDKETKLMASVAVGKRTADNARRFMCDLASRLVLPTATDTGVREVEFLPQISTDGFAAYPEAVDLAFGDYCKYGQIIKNYRNTDMPGRYAAPEMIDTDRKIIFGDFGKKTICTSHVERNNLTIRTFMRRFSRLSLGFSKKLENLSAAVFLHTAYFDFCWRPREKGTSGRLRVTPAMAAGIVRDVWSVEDLLNAATG